MRLAFILMFGLVSAYLPGQGCGYLAEKDIKSIEEHLRFLASDELQGRAPGSEGIAMAAEYLEAQFKQAGLEGFFSGNYRQPFQVPSGVSIAPALNQLAVDGQSLSLGADFYPTQFSSNGSVQGETHYVSFGIESKELKRDDIKDRKVKGAIAVMEIGSPDGIHPHSKFRAYHDIFTRVDNLKEKGALAVILVDSEGQRPDPKRQYRQLNAAGIPVVFVPEAAWAREFKGSREVKLAVVQEAQELTAYNLAGWVNNQAPTTIVIGAHYDHLGMGGEGSRFRGEGEAIHNGADDNASGTAGLLELARFLGRTEDARFRRHNFLFVAFSAEEMGLLGSSYFVENGLDEDLPLLYMLNMDMIGRMEESTLQINGIGTSPAWEKLLASAECALNYVTSSSGVGPSDHTSFYYEEVPALHFFTGTHRDYHTPSDDFEKINFEGIWQTLNLILELVGKTADNEAFPFTPTKNESQKAPRFSVTLGVLPDYLYSGNGMKIDGVTEGKPAAKAGLQAGDVVTKLGEVKVSDMQSYMQALGQFKSGDAAVLEYERAGKALRATVQF